jgi:hypothetical protein
MTVANVAAGAVRAASAGVEKAVEGVRRAAAPSGAAQDSASLSEEAVRLLVAAREYESAIELARTADEIAEATIDLMA